MNTPFQNVLAEWPPERVTALIASATESDVCRARADTGRFDPQRLAALLSPAARPGLEAQAQVASAVTRRRFGWAMQFFAPLYVSNYCCNSCVYCGFNRAAAVARRALSLDEAEAEADWLARQGFAHLLLVAGDDRRHTPPAYFEALVRRIAGRFASIQAEIYGLSREEYAGLVAAGCDGITMFQETYDPARYRALHPAGPKADFADRLDTPERAAAAGMTFLGIGALLGLHDWRTEAFYTGLHADHLQRTWWRSSVALSFPRMRPAHGCMPPPCPVGDADLVQLMTALRIQLPDVGMTLSTREPAGLREQLARICATKLSAGACTSPGGYSEKTDAEPQFDVADHRPLTEVRAALASLGFDPVLKDWDRAYHAAG
jgi:2-iminoacetate synthase